MTDVDAIVVTQGDERAAEAIRRGIGGKYDREHQHNVQAFATHRTQSTAALEARARELEGALQPFVDIGKQTGAHGVISKKLNGFAPLTVTVTKAQMQRALNAYTARKALHDPREG